MIRESPSGENSGDSGCGHGGQRVLAAVSFGQGLLAD